MFSGRAVNFDVLITISIILFGRVWFSIMTPCLPSFNSEAGIPLVPLFYVTKRMFSVLT